MRRPHPGSVPTQRGRPPGFGVGFRVCTEVPCVCAFWRGEDPRVGGLLGLRASHDFHLVNWPLPGGPQASGGGADAARRGSGLLLLLPCPRDTPRGVSWHRPHAPGPGQTACGAPPRPGVSLGSQTW